MFKSAADLVSAMDSNWLYLFPYYLPASRHVDIHYYVGFCDRLCVCVGTVCLRHSIANRAQKYRLHRKPDSSQAEIIVGFYDKPRYNKKNTKSHWIETILKMLVREEYDILIVVKL